MDVTFGEDECRIRSLHSPQNFAFLRRITLNALERETFFHRSIRQKSRRAAMNDQYTALPAIMQYSSPLNPVLS
ncbi:MAG: hypothetical protein V7K42_12810 [Nostoc sp.]